MTDERERLEADIARAIADFTCGSVGYNTVLARAALQAIEQSGFWLAPVTPTEEMVEEGGLQLYREDRNGGIPFDGNYRPHATATYKAMQSASRSSSRKG